MVNIIKEKNFSLQLKFFLYILIKRFFLNFSIKGKKERKEVIFIYFIVTVFDNKNLLISLTIKNYYLFIINKIK